MTHRVLLTGAGGFIGSHVLRHFLAETGWDVVALDSFRHKGKTDRITQQLEHMVWEGREIPAGFLDVITHDLCAPISPQMAHRIGRIDYVIAMASQSHVDRSIEDPAAFIRNNTEVILSTLQYARAVQPQAVIVISTDEVYGPVHPGSAHLEWSPVLPSNPYAASKACQEAIAISYWRTYGLPVVIVNCMNLIGEMQDTEKFLPMLISRISKGEVVTIHGRPGNIGSRHYLHARNLADALVYILRNLPPRMYPAYAPLLELTGSNRAALAANIAERPDRYNIVGPDRISNLEMAEMVAVEVGRPLHYDLVDFHSTRPGHDPHYGLDGGKLAALGWKPPVPFAESLAKTIRWTLDHPEWLM